MSGRALNPSLKHPPAPKSGAPKRRGGKSSVRFSDDKKGKQASVQKSQTDRQPPFKRLRVNEDPVVSPSSTKGKDTEASSQPTFMVIAGSYEKLLYGLEVTYSRSPLAASESGDKTRLRVSLEPVFIFPAHVGSVKAVAASPEGGKWLVTGSIDEIIKVWDLKRRKEVGGLMQHTGSVTHLTFPTRTHLMSASEDGTIALFHTREWSVLRTFKGHAGRVNAVAVHPSGKVALSVGKDKMLRMWDMMRGKGKGATKLGKEGEGVRWDTTGKRFVVVAGKSVDIYTINMVIFTSIDHTSRIHEVRFIKHPAHPSADDLIFIAAEDRKISVYELRHRPVEAAANQSTPEEGDEQPKSTSQYVLIAELVGHENRVKAIDEFPLSIPSSPNGDGFTTKILASCSSDGKIHIYDLSLLPAPCLAASLSDDLVKKLEPIGLYDTKGTRLTCLTLASGDARVPGLPVRDDHGDETNEEKSREDEEGEEWGSDGSDGERERSEKEDEDWGGVRGGAYQVL